MANTTVNSQMVGLCCMITVCTDNSNYMLICIHGDYDDDQMYVCLYVMIQRWWHDYNYKMHMYDWKIFLN